MAAYYFYWSLGTCGIKTHIIGHNLLSFRVSKYLQNIQIISKVIKKVLVDYSIITNLIATQSMAIAQSNIFTSSPAHRVEAVILNLFMLMNIRTLDITQIVII